MFFKPKIVKPQNIPGMAIALQMPKTGSNTVKETLYRLFGRDNAYRVHYLDAGFFDRVMRAFVNHEISVDYNIFYYFLQHTAERGKILKRLRDNTSEPVYVIAAVREPVAMFIATFFQLLDNFSEFTNDNIWEHMPFDKVLSTCHDFLCPDNNVLPGFSRELGISNFGGYPPAHDIIYSAKMADVIRDFPNWFDDNIKQFFGIDVFSHRFSTEKGYCILEHGRFRILIYTFEQNISHLDVPLKKFFGRDVQIYNDNLSNIKNYAGLYRQTKDSLRLPEDYLQQLYSCRTVQHFYSKCKIQELLIKWRQ